MWYLFNLSVISFGYEYSCQGERRISCSWQERRQKFAVQKCMKENNFVSQGHNPAFDLYRRKLYRKGIFGL